MRRHILPAVILFLFSLSMCASAQTAVRGYVVGFYNLENLFDTYHDDGKNDYQFLPDGDNHWTEARYQKKLHNMASVIRAMKDENGRYHTILGISEVENRHVIDDLVNQPEIADANYQIVHYDGPDRRGVDVALLYRPGQFKLLESRSIPFNFNSSIKFAMADEDKPKFRTRDILMVRGMIGGEMFAFFVAHLSSRLGGKGGDLRSRGAEQIYEASMELQSKYPGIKIVVMGDMNDNPTDISMVKYLHGKPTLKETTDTDFFSPFIRMLEAGYGSLAYRGEWCIYDIIMVNCNIANPAVGTLGITPVVKTRKDQFYGRIFHKDFMVTQNGQNKGTPFRTFSGGSYIGGYSDHYPTYIVLGK